MIGSPPQDLKYGGEPSYLVVGDRTVMREYVTANLATEPGSTTRIGSDCLLMAYSHVAHNCQVGDHVILANSVQMAGYVTVEDWAIVGGGDAGAPVRAHRLPRDGRRRFADLAGHRAVHQVGRQSAAPRGHQHRRARAPRRSRARRVDALERAYRILFRERTDRGRSGRRACAREFPGMPEVEHLARFAETSTRGLTR